MVFISVLAALQMLMIPGILAVHCFNPAKLTPIAFFATVLPLSLTINYFLAVTFILLNIYTPLTLYILMALELVACLLLCKVHPVGISFPKPQKEQAFAIYATLILLVLLYLYTSSTTSPAKIFCSWDDVVSWNRWAEALASGTIPSSWHYPLALPANWSIAYVMYGAVIEYLPKFIHPVYIYMLCALLVEESSAEKSHAPLCSGFFILILFRMTGHIHNGYMDIPVAAISAISFLLLGKGIRESNEPLKNMGALIAISSGIVKQAGLFTCAAYLILFLAFDSSKTKKQKFLFTIIYMGATCILLGSFYIYAHYLILKGRNTSEILYVTNLIYGGTPVYKRIFPALLTVFQDNRFITLICVPFIFTQKHTFKKAIGIAGLVYLLFWASFWCYDTRNSMLAWPLIVYSGICGIFELLTIKRWDALMHFLKKDKYIVFCACAVAIIAGSLVCSLKITKPMLLEKQEKAKRHRGGEGLKIIERYYEEQGAEFKFLSNNQPLGWSGQDSPVTKNYVAFYDFSLASVKQKIQETGITHLFIIDMREKESWIDQAIQDGTCTEIYRKGDTMFLRIEDKDAL